mmetsp:Transcript_14264/g.33757  ORF Transcript_14264/g.33757 Transcript_14264/m.33757 type:complete len:270 (-) Transcript_14264:327-1136(-)
MPQLICGRVRCSSIQVCCRVLLSDPAVYEQGLGVGFDQCWGSSGRGPQSQDLGAIERDAGAGGLELVDERGRRHAVAHVPAKQHHDTRVVHRRVRNDRAELPQRGVLDLTFSKLEPTVLEILTLVVDEWSALHEINEGQRLGPSQQNELAVEAWDRHADGRHQPVQRRTHLEQDKRGQPGGEADSVIFPQVRKHFELHADPRARILGTVAKAADASVDHHPRPRDGRQRVSEASRDPVQLRGVPALLRGAPIELVGEQRHPWRPGSERH